MDIMGEFTPAPGKKKYLLVAIDYFTKWVEAEPVAKITTKEVEKFFRDKVIYRFGLPRTLITDNGKQFDSARFKLFCEEYRIDLKHSSVYYPQSHGQVEVTNRTLLAGLRKRLEEHKGKWAEELRSVLWAYRTTPRSPTGESPFRLAYGTEALAPVEVMAISHRVAHYNERENEEGLRANLDFLEEVRDIAADRNEVYKKRTARYYNAKVKKKIFREGDLVLRKASASDPRSKNKLSENWEGPYIVSKVVCPGTVHLKTQRGERVGKSWNAFNLKKYYQ